MGQLTSSTWQKGKGKTKTGARSASKKPLTRKTSQTQKQQSKPTKEKTERAAKQRKEGSEGKSSIPKIAAVIVALGLVGGGGYYAYSNDMIPGAGDTGREVTISRDDVEGASGDNLDANAPAEDAHSAAEGEDSAQREVPPAITPQELAAAVASSYTDAITTRGTTDIEGQTMTFDTTWFQDSSNGAGTITWNGMDAPVKVYKGTVLVNNDTGILDAYTGKDLEVKGWVIVVDETPFLRAFPGKAGVAPLTNTSDNLVVEGNTARVDDISAEVVDGKVVKYTTKVVSYDIESADPSAVETVSAGEFKANGSLRKDEGGNWVGELFE